MNYLLEKAFDKTYFLLAPAVLLTYFVPIRMRVGPIMIIPFVIIWFLAIIFKGEKCNGVCTRKFFNFFIPLLSFFLIRSFLSGYGEYDRVPLSRHIQYSGLVCIYLYIFHYTVSRYKFKELSFLNCIIFFSLIYGCFASISMDIGTYRNMGVVAGTARETFSDIMDRLEYASSGVSNFGDVYAMVSISIGLIAIGKYCNIKWKFLYTILVLLFFYGIYKAAYSTGLVVAILTSLFVFLLRVLKIRRVGFKILISFFAIGVVVMVAFPVVLSPFAGVLKDLSLAIEPISYEYSLRLMSVSEAVSGFKDTYAIQRAELYWNSLDIFIHRPIYGYRLNQILFNADMDMSFLGHSYFFDSLAMGGMVLGGLLIVGLYNFTKYIKYTYKSVGLNQNLLDGWLGATSAIFIVACINQIDMFNILIGYLFVVPSIPFLNYKHHLEHNPSNRQIFY